MQPFNADFYVAGATVIPVLFLALLLSGGPLAKYALWAKRQRSEQLRRIIKAEQGIENVSATRLWWVRNTYYLLSLPTTLVLVFFVGGEISAAYALDHRHATSSEHGWVLAALVVLPIITVLVVLASVSFTWARDIRGSTPQPAMSSDE
jgi:hypothetical protein